VLVPLSPDSLDFKSSSQRLGVLGTQLFVWAGLVAWALATTNAALVFVCGLIFLFLILPVVFAMMRQRRVRMDRGADAIQMRWLFQELPLCRASDVVAVQVIGDAERYELNLVFDGRPRFNLAACKKAPDKYKRLEKDDCKRLLRHAGQLAAFLEVPLVDQVKAMGVVEPVRWPSRTWGMAAGLPSEIRVVDFPGGRRYELPRRPLDQSERTRFRRHMLLGLVLLLAAVLSLTLVRTTLATSSIEGVALLISGGLLLVGSSVCLGLVQIFATAAESD
jgi:hypothetical protein